LVLKLGDGELQMIDENFVVFANGAFGCQFSPQSIDKFFVYRFIHACD
jgi:hypothetical protein